LAGSEFVIKFGLEYEFGPRYCFLSIKIIEKFTAPTCTLFRFVGNLTFLIVKIGKKLTG
jgi:hypothetical protein